MQENALRVTALAAHFDMSLNSVSKHIKVLEEAGLVTVEWRAGDGGPGRKFYDLTDAGRAEHQRQTADWRAFTEVTTTFISTAAPTSGEDPS